MKRDKGKMKEMTFFFWKKGITLTQFSSRPSDNISVKKTTLNQCEVLASDKALEFLFTA
jgi:hypothetical protein